LPVRGHNRRLPAILRQVLTRALRARLALPTLAGQQGRRSMVYQADQANAGPLIIKLATARNSYPVEAWVYRALREQGVPAPEVLYYRARLPQLGIPCLVLSKIGGEPLYRQQLDEAATVQLYGEVGELLRRIHSVPLPGARYGLGAFLPAHSGAAYASWAAFITACHDHPGSIAYLRTHGLLRGLGDAAAAQLGGRIAAHQHSAVLNHGDFGPDHIYASQGRVTGVIDAGEAFAGPAEYDLAYLGSYLSGDQFELVLRRYGSADLQMLCLYAVLIAAHKAARAHRAGQAARARHFCAIAERAWAGSSGQGGDGADGAMPFGLPLRRTPGDRPH
jgi:aminoglycoside phosphotransferase (APT) family kinase protein